MLLTDDEYYEFVGERRRQTGPSQQPVTAPHPTYGGQSYDWAETLPDYGAGNDPFGYMNPQDIGLQPDRPTYAEEDLRWQGDPFYDLSRVGVDTRRDENYGLNFGWTFAPAADMGGLDTIQGTPGDGQVMTGVENLPGWDPYATPYTKDPGYWRDAQFQDIANKAIMSSMSGERTLGHLGIDTSGLPDQWYFPVRQAVDVAAAPATWATAGLGPEVPIIGSALGGRFLTRLGGEIVMGTIGTAAGQGASELYANSPLPGHDNALAQMGVGLGAGILAGGAALEGMEVGGPLLKAGAKQYGHDISGSSALLGRRLNAGEQMLHGAIDPATGRPFDYAPILGGADVPENSVADGPLGQAARLAKAPLDNGAEVVEYGTNRVWKVVKGYSGDGEGLVRVVDPETGDTERIARFLLREPGEGAAQEMNRWVPLPPETPIAKIPVIRTGPDLIDAYAAVQGHDPYNPQLFVRWSDSIAKDVENGERSQRVLGSGSYERGLSSIYYLPVRGHEVTPLELASAFAEYSTIAYGKRGWLITGDIVGTGADGEPLLENVMVVGRIDPALVKAAKRIKPEDSSFRRSVGEERWAQIELERAQAQVVAERRGLVPKQPRAKPEPATLAASAAAKLEEAPVSVGARSADGAAPADVPGDIKLPRTANGDLEPPRTPPPAPSGDQSFTQAIMNHLKGEWYYRISGQADAELRVGRRGQAEGILAGLDSTGDSTEALRAAREGARGRILSTREPLVLTAAQRVEANDAMVGAARTNKITAFELLNVQDGLEAMLRGERPQPKQMQLVRKVFGDDVADLAYQMPVNEAARQRQMVVDAKKAAENWERAVRKETARQQAEVERAQREAARAFERAMKAEKVAQARAQKEAERAAAKAAKAFADADRAEIDAGRRLQAEVQRKAERDAQRALVRENRAGAIAAEARDRANPNDEQIIQKAKGIIEARVAPELQETANAIVDTWVKGNRVLLDGIGEASNRRLAAIARNLRAGVSGHLGDSYVTQLVTQRSILRGTLEEAGVNRDLAKKMADLMVDEELAKRYKGEVPERISKLLQLSKGSAYNDEMGTVMRGASTFNQWWKNTAFGLMDVGVVGVQGLHSVQTGGLSILTGMANRAASLIPLMPHVDTSGEVLARRAQYALDGLIHGPTGIADDSGTFIGQLGRVGKAIDDHTFGAALRFNNRVSFGMLLGNLRALAHEGNLVLARAAGADITDPAVRRASAIRANSATMAAFRPASSRRALAEQATLMTGSMTRAQAQQVDQVVKGFLRPTNRAEFMMSAATIASVGLSAYVFGKVLNDAIGMDEFEWDPGKPNWGNISVPGPNGTVYKVNVFPQHQVAKYTIQAIEALAKAEPAEAEQAMLKLGLGRSGPALQLAEKVAGYGFDPISGKYAMGDWGKGMSPGERAASASGLPPTLFNILTGAADSIETTAGFFGMSAFKEPASQTYDRRWREGYGGRRWGDLSSDERAEIEKRFGQRPYADDPEIAKSQREADAIKANRVQHEFDAAKAYRDALGAATTETEKRDAGKRLRDEMGRISDIANAQYEQWSQGKNFGPQNPLDEARSAYFDTFKQATVGGVLDEEKQQGLLTKLEAGWSAEQKAYVEAALGRRKESADPALQELFDAQKAIRDSGYFDVTENKRQWRQAHPEIDALLRKYGYGETTTKAMDVIATLHGQQSASDAKLDSGSLTPEQWRKDLGNRELEKRAKFDVLYGDLPEKERTALSAYFDAITEATGADGVVNFTKVDRWLATQPEDVRKAVAERARDDLSPMAAQFHADQGKIAASGYWDISDRVAARVAEGMGLQIESADQMRQMIWQRVLQTVLSRGYDRISANQLADQITSQIMKPVDDVTATVRKAWRTAAQDPRNADLYEARELLIKWDYLDPGKEDTAKDVAIRTAVGAR